MNIIGKNLYKPIGIGLTRQLSSVKLPKVSHLPPNNDTTPSAGVCMKIMKTHRHAIAANPILPGIANLEKEFPDVKLILKKLPDITEKQKRYLSKNLGFQI